MHIIEDLYLHVYYFYCLLKSFKWQIIYKNRNHRKTLRAYTQVVINILFFFIFEYGFLKVFIQ